MLIRRERKHFVELYSKCLLEVDVVMDKIPRPLKEE